MGITVKPVVTARERRDFLLLPWRIYEGDRNWVPPLRGEMRRIIDPRRNSHLRRGPHRLFLASRDGVPVGRIMTGVDEGINAIKGTADGWFALFEAMADYEVAETLLGAAAAYLSSLGLK